MFDLVVAGIEAGSKVAIERDWSLFDARDIIDRWRETPPLPVMAVLIGRALGVNLGSPGPRQPPLSAADAEAALFAELGHLPTITYAAPARGVPIGEKAA